MTDYKMYIFAIYGSAVDAVIQPGLSPPVNVYSCHEGEGISENTDFVVPTITEDGRITFLLIGKISDLNKLQQGIAMSFTPYIQQLHSNGIQDVSIGNFAIAGTAIHLPEAPNIKSLIFKTLVFPKPLPELVQIYSALKLYCEVSGTAEEENTRLQIQSYYTQGLQKKWVNDVINGWRQRLNWNEVVNAALKEMEKRKA